jgi:hypothetical protein
MKERGERKRAEKERKKVNTSFIIILSYAFSLEHKFVLSVI